MAKKSLLEALPEIVAKGKLEAERILEGIEGRNRVTLQTRELVIPQRATAQHGLTFNKTGGGYYRIPPLLTA